MKDQGVQSSKFIVKKCEKLIFQFIGYLMQKMQFLGTMDIFIPINRWEKHIKYFFSHSELPKSKRKMKKKLQTYCIFNIRSNQSNNSQIMIRIIYRNQKAWKLPHAVWSVLLLVINTIIFQYSMLKCCFQQLAPRPPIAVSVVFLALVLADRLYPFYKTKKIAWIRLSVDMVVWILIALSAFLPEENVVCFLGLAAVVFMYDVVYLKQLLFDLLRRHLILYKIYILVKITYWLMVYSQFIGCIFYAIQMNLIEKQAFGPFELNPLNYYQGQLLAYTPIFMFHDLNRYVYAMYYSFSLSSSIAFGDIIGKNWIQDVYVLILIVLSTVLIALIVEQMYMVFQEKKSRFFQLLNDIRFLSQRLIGYPQIPATFRTEIINFLTEANWKSLTEEPAELQTSIQFKAKLMRQSVVYNEDLPLFYAKYALHRLKLTHLPKGVLVYHNLPKKQQLVSFLVTKGKFWVGYSTLKGTMAGGYTLQKEGMNFGVEEAIVGTNHIYRNLQVRTVTSGCVLTISRELQDIDFPFDKPIEHFQNAKDYAIFNRHKYSCSICLTQQHTLLDCPTCHYVVSYSTKIEITNKTLPRSLGKRKNTKSQKIRDLHLETIEQKSSKSWRLMQIQRYRNIFNKLKSYQSQEVIQLQQWHQWNVYATNDTASKQEEQKIKTRLTNSNISYTVRQTRYF